MISYKFSNKQLFIQALTHRSIGSNNNERLEYLGDAILGFIIAEILYKKFPDTSEGELTRLRASLVKGEKLAEIAKQIGLADQVKLGPGELKSGGWRRDSILANTVEALIGAIYLDSNIDACQRFILNIYEPHLDQIDPGNIKKDAKSRLQEHLQSRGQAVPVYETIKESGFAHNPEFTVSCKIDVLDDIVIASGQSKRKAEQAAAEKVLQLLKVTE